MLNLATLLEDSVRDNPDNIAVIFNEMKLPYQAINAAANQVANGLATLGIQKGDKVALSCPNIPFFPIIYYGILKAGAVVVPLNVLLKSREITYHLQDSEAKAYFCFEGTEQLPMGEMGYGGFQRADGCDHFFLITVNPAAPSPIADAKTMGALIADQLPTFETVQTSSEDTSVILYTSGTTGQPKGAELSHLNMVMNARLADSLFGRTDGDVHLVVLPLFHSFGQSVQMNAGFYTGAALSLLPRFDADAALGIMERDNVTFFAGVPTMYWAMLHSPNVDQFDLEKISNNLRLAVSGGAAMPVEVMKAFEEKFNVKIQEGYGLSETSPVASFNRLDRERKPGSVGLPVWGVEMHIVDELDNQAAQGDLGEIVIRGHNVMKGYYNRPEATAEAFQGGWFHTGDIGRMDEDGYFYIVDRVKDMVIRGGFNVYPREIEEVLMSHPKVSLAAVIGVPDEQYGEEIKAFIVPTAAADVTSDEIIAWSKENMASYKYPRSVEIRDTLPMNATGKILKSELRDGS
jgi:long-chain acyl-CoA synthetase